MDPLLLGELNRPKRVKSLAIPEDISPQLHRTGKWQDLILGEISGISFLKSGGTKSKTDQFLVENRVNYFQGRYAPEAS